LPIIIATMNIIIVITRDFIEMRRIYMGKIRQRTLV